ncbi:hypothetical protein CDL15_Pgr015603 [Punica granatum]|uniref:Uncharacterized protein n=1 Tax=Punica granatum TaxID=22663 RepID=A0A218XP62_PUNGR|nr:hypothetical protein CDL15_Pgr015603 [Punica granatum]
MGSSPPTTNNIQHSAQLVIGRAPVIGELSKQAHTHGEKGDEWVIRNGTPASFWTDRWVGTCPLRSIIQGHSLFSKIVG